MKVNMGETIKQARKALGISQEALAKEMELSVQAVSKWECGLSCPDIALLPQLVDCLGISLDMLLRGEETEEKGMMSALPNDDKLRIVQCVGQKIVSKKEWKLLGQQEKIPLFIDESRIEESSIIVEIWGSAEIEGDVAGSVDAGDSVTCGDVSGSVSAGCSVTCGDVSGSVSAGCSVTCFDVGGDICAGAGVTCSKQ